MLNQNTLRALFWVVTVAVIVLLLLPGGLFGAVTLPGADLLVHLIMMATLSALGVVAYARYRLPIVLGLITLAILSEILQIMVPSRYFDLMDLAANGAGIALGLIVGVMVMPIVLKRTPAALNR